MIPLEERESNEPRIRKLRANLANMDRRSARLQLESPLDMSLTKKGQLREFLRRSMPSYTAPPVAVEGKTKRAVSKWVMRMKHSNRMRKEVASKLHLSRSPMQQQPEPPTTQAKIKMEQIRRAFLRIALTHLTLLQLTLTLLG